jgi:alpha-beta hydrolase superfamily lysophospholipase
VLLGTSGKNPAVALGKLVADLMTLLRGRRYRSRLLAKMTFMGYLGHFKDEGSPLSWLTRDADWRRMLGEDSLCRFIFTVSAYRELFAMLADVNRRAWFKKLPKTLLITFSNSLKLVLLKKKSPLN